MTAAVVHYVKHWDNDTKGHIEFSEVRDLNHALKMTESQLTAEALEDDVNAIDWVDSLFTITKAELVDSVQAYAGVPRASF